MTRTAYRSAARNAGDGRGATREWPYRAPHGLNGPLARALSSERGIGQAARANFGLSIAYVCGKIIEGKENGESRFMLRRTQCGK